MGVITVCSRNIHLTGRLSYQMLSSTECFAKLNIFREKNNLYIVCVLFREERITLKDVVVVVVLMPIQQLKRWQINWKQCKNATRKYFY
jgi:hypothetical protein